MRLEILQPPPSQSADMITSIQRQKKIEESRYEDLGITIRQNGIGDVIQFTSLPENFFKKTGKRLIDVNKVWCFDYNPFVERNKEAKKIVQLWSGSNNPYRKKPKNSAYLSNSEAHCHLLGLDSPHLTRPILYEYDQFPYEYRHRILFHPFGNSHGALPKKVIDHVIEKYMPTGRLYQIGDPAEPNLGIARIHTSTHWDLCKEISQCRLFIGIDSGPAWIAACYPDVVVKKVRVKFQDGFGEYKDWMPLDVNNPHSLWDDLGLFKIYNCFEEDIGFTKSYKEL